MNPIRTFNDLEKLFATIRPAPRVAVVCPSDLHTMQVVDRCLQFNLARFTLVCSESSQWADDLERGGNPDVSVIRTDSVDSAAAVAVEQIRNNRCDVLMKGAINTDNLLHAVLNKECGLLEPGHVLTHVTAASLPAYDKMLFFSDAAVIPEPELPQLDAMIRYDVDLLHKLGNLKPHVALIHFSEKTNPRFTSTIFYQEIKRRADGGDYGKGTVVGGPMDVKTACDRHSAEIKHIESPVAGHADILIFPSLVAANTFYKSISFFGHATMAGIICGATAPIVIPSRADSAESKFYSLALACIAGARKTETE